MRPAARSRTRSSRCVTFSALLAGQNDRRLIFAATIQDRDIADSTDQRGGGSLDQFVDCRIPRSAIADAEFDLEQFVMLQILVEFGEQAWRDTRRADVDDGLQAMRETAQVLLLFVAEFHGHNCRPA